MNNKIIGFTISNNAIDHNDVDVFKRQLRLIHLKNKNFHIYIWGIGDIGQCTVNNRYSLSFPLTASLLDRNVLLQIGEETIIVENDWLGSIPVFYNRKSRIVSTLPIKCLANKTVHNEGLYNFFEFGFSVFEQTPVADVRFMRYYSSLIVSKSGINTMYKKDPVETIYPFTQNIDEREVLQMIEDYTQTVEKQTSGDIVLPTSGGYDSRLLNVLIKNRARIKSFTYGLSKNQSESYEVIHAKKLSEILDIDWQQIELSHYYRYIPQWYALFGFSTHLHGMYHIEFYKKIIETGKLRPGATWLSGIFGDVWAGKVKYAPVKKPSDLVNLAYTHEISIKPGYFLQCHEEDTLKTGFFNTYRALFSAPELKPLFTIRIKLMLISYLMQLPEYFGFPAWTPFLNFEIALAILQIPPERRKNRQWQTDFFTEKGIALEKMALSARRNNQLVYSAAKNYQFEPLHIHNLHQYLPEKYLRHINHTLQKQNLKSDIKNRIMTTPKVKEICRILGMRNTYYDALLDYWILKPIDWLLCDDKHSNL